MPRNREKFLVKPQLISIVAYVQLETNDHTWLFNSLCEHIRVHGLQVQSLFTYDMINNATALRHQVQQLYSASEALFDKGKPLEKSSDYLDD